jgi:hypothetical protein
MSRVQITNQGDAPVHVFAGNPDNPTSVQELAPGDAVTLPADADVRVISAASSPAKDRRAAGQSLTGRRSADLTAQQGRPFGTHHAAHNAPGMHHGVAVNVASSAPGGTGTKTDDATDVPKNAVGEHVQGDTSEATKTRDTGKPPKHR